MPKRDYAAEISAIRARLLPEGSLLRQLMPRATRLDAARDHIADMYDSDVRSELARYLPIGYVACIEGFIRLVIRDLIDNNESCRQNVVQFKDLRFGLDQAVALQLGTFSLGEFISHLLPISSLPDIDASVSTLIGESFLDRVRTAEWVSSSTRRSLTIAGLENKVMSDISRLFELRHILAHELGTSMALKVDDVIRSCRAASLFIGVVGIVAQKVGGEKQQEATAPAGGNGA